MANVFLGPEDNTFTAAAAGDAVFGEGGNDTLTANGGGSTLYGGEGDDVLKGGSGNDTLFGDSEPGSFYKNVLKGFGGDDVIVSSSWYDQIDAGSGNDLVSSSAQITDQVIDGGKGFDQITITSLRDVNDPVNLIMGPIFVCIIKGINGATYMNFEQLNITLGTGAATIEAGNGADTINFAYLNGTNATTEFEAGFVRSGGGDDAVAFNGLTRVGSGIERLDGGTGTDRLSWTNGGAAISDLEIDAQKGTLTASGRKFATFDGFEILSFLTFENITGDLQYRGFGGVDSLRLGFVAGSIDTFGGNDSITVLAGRATVNAGGGDDLVRVDYPNTAGCVLFGGDGNDSLSGGSGKDDLYGGKGNDSLGASNSHARLYGETGNDTLSFSFNASAIGGGAAVIDGGSGRDALVLQLLVSAAPYTLDLSAAVITLADGSVISRIEAVNCTGGLGADDLTASNDGAGLTANLLDGQGGDDTLRANTRGATLNGGFGADRLIGAAGDDLLQGGFGADADILGGGGGADGLFGGSGADLLTGGAGADRFGLAEYYESGVTETTRDVILDFSRADGDRIDLGAVDAVQAVLEDQAFAFIGAVDFDDQAGELRFDRVDPAGSRNDHTLISGDINGDSIADFTIEIAGLVTLREADFLL